MPDGLWTERNGEHPALPLLLPQALPARDEGLRYLLDFWTAKDYFRPAHKSRNEGTVDFFEGWLEEARTTGLSRHQASGTFIGGHRGVVWVVRGLIKFLANIGACVGKLNPPIPAPENFELDRLGMIHWNRALRWCEEWRLELEKSNATLKETAAERMYPPEPTEERTERISIDRSDDEATPEPEEDIGQALASKGPIGRR
jgi:hypothetical protein